MTDVSAPVQPGRRRGPYPDDRSPAADRDDVSAADEKRYAAASSS